MVTVRWWRLFIDKLTGSNKAAGVVGHRRRKSQRYPYEVQLTAKCSSWPKLIDLFTDDVSEGGLFIPTEASAEVGEEVQVTLSLPAGDPMQLAGTVVRVISSERAAEFGKRGGLGVALAQLEGDNKARFDRVLAEARASAPIPTDTLDGKPVPRFPSPADGTPAITPTGSVRLSAVHDAIAAARALETPVDLTEEDDLVIHEAEPEPAPEPVLPLPKREQAMPPPIPGAKPPVEFRETGSQESIPKAPAVHTGDPDPIVGIDLGTTYTSVAAVVGKKVSILPWPDGAKSWASVVAFPALHECLVGTEARKRLATDPPHTVASPKRLLGRRYDDREIQGFIGAAPYRTLAGPDGSVVVEIWGQQYAITQLCGYIVEEARRVAETALGREVRRAVMTCPVSFDDDRSRIFQRAGEMAHLEIVAMIDEPSAAALANRFDPNFGGVVGVYDFGGGTFDFSVVDVSKGDFQVLATAGDTWLGGDDFDSILAEAAANQFWRMHKVDLRKQAVEWQKLVFACERAKRMLSVENEGAIYVPEVLRSAEGMVDLNISLDRATFERACKPVVDRSLATCDEALELLGMKPSDLSTVYLSGGTTYIPTVREALARHFAVPVRTGVPPEHAVCLGAAIHAAQIQFRAATTLDAR